MAAAADDLLLVSEDLETAIDLNAIEDADAEMTPVADDTTGDTFRFTNTGRTFVIVKNGHISAVTFTIAAIASVNVPSYGSQTMAAIVIEVAAGHFGIIVAPSGYGTDEIVSVAVTYSGDADDGDILAGAFAIDV